MQALARLYRNTLFRLTLLAAGLFVLSSLITLGYIYYSTIASDIRQVDEELLAEVNELEAVFEEQGANALGQIVNFRSLTGQGDYLLNIGRISGGSLDLTGQPEDAGFADIEVSDTVLADGEDKEYRFFYFVVNDARGLDGDLLPDNEVRSIRSRGVSTPLVTATGQQVGVLIVARKIEQTMFNAERIRTSILASAIIATVLGLLSALVVSRRFSSRVETFNTLATDVMSGNMKVRASRNYSEDELDQLAENLNGMLDHIDRLMSAMRYAGDSIAHDLRSPLTRLRTRLETAAQDAGGETGRILQDAANDADELLSTFDSVLRIARLEAADRREILKMVNPAPLVEDIVELYEPSFEDAGLVLETDIKADLRIKADRGLLSQAVSNLVENAIKYTPDGGRVRVSMIKVRGGRVELVISDTGPGIPEHMRQRVKERFVRLDQSRTAPGSGLGLALVDAIAEVHRAEFSLRDGLGDEAEGETPGLAAVLSFPRVKLVRGKIEDDTGAARQVA